MTRESKTINWGKEHRKRYLYRSESGINEDVNFDTITTSTQ